MKTRTILILIAAMMLGCSNPEQELVKEVETYFISTLNDPKSYERESFIITDSMTNLEYDKRVAEIDLSSIKLSLELAEDFLKGDQSMLELIRDNYYKNKVKNGIREVDSLKFLYNQSLKKEEELNSKIDDGTIKFIFFNATYRAKNRFGALVKGESKIQYDINTKEYQIYE